MVPTRHADVMRQLFGLTLRTLDEGSELERIVRTASISSRFGNPTFRLCGHSMYSWSIGSIRRRPQNTCILYRRS